jgi:5-methylcytosine-specific restriction protein A
MKYRVCAIRHCKAILPPGHWSEFCEEHIQFSYVNRPSPSRRGYTRKWGRARQRYLGAHPLCAGCLEIGVIEPATEVDHIIPHRGDQALFWDSTNWQGLCKSCHSKKTMEEEYERKGGDESTGEGAADKGAGYIKGRMGSEKRAYWGRSRKGKAEAPKVNANRQPKVMVKVNE